jgi:hypothetical protein
MAIGVPPAMGIDKTTTLIHSKLADVTNQAMVSLHKRNRDIELKVRESKIIIEESQITIQESHTSIKRLESMLEESKQELERYRSQEEC